MSEVKQLVKSDFAILDKEDEEQIKNAGEAVRQALCYELKKNGKTTRQITFIGLKWITVKMSQAGQPLEVVDSHIVLDKDEINDKKLWFWRARVKSRNHKTGLETEGVAECPYLERKNEYIAGKATGKVIIGDYDPFGRTKAHSKAERNSWRKQIPELEITALLDNVKKDEIKNVQGTDAGTKNTTGGFCHCPDEATIPEWETGKCKNCNQTMSDFKKTRMKSD